MTKVVKEVTSGAQFSRSSNAGELADSLSRTFRVVLDSPDESIDFQAACGVKIGDQHPSIGTLYCVSFDARYDGDSRMAMLASFSYQSTPSQESSNGGQDPKSMPPEQRPPNWSTSTSLIEQPLYTWRRRIDEEAWAEDEEPAANPVGDIYDGVSKLVSMVTINVQLFVANDPTIDNELAGSINRDTIVLGTLNMKPHTVMFRGVQSQPVAESWGGRLFRGWNATYEFAYKRNTTKVRIGEQLQVDWTLDLGWDIAIPLTGFNVRAFSPGAARPDEDVYGQPLRHGERGVIQIDDFLNRPYLPDGVNAGDKVRAMVKVFSYEGGGASQAPSASPIALTPDGRPLLTHDANGNLVNKPIVYGYQVQPDINFKQTLGEGRLFR